MSPRLVCVGRTQPHTRTTAVTTLYCTIQHILCTEFQFLFSRQHTHTQSIENHRSNACPSFLSFLLLATSQQGPESESHTPKKAFLHHFSVLTQNLVGHHIQNTELAGVAAPHPPSSPTTYNRIPLLSSATRCARALRPASIISFVQPAGARGVGGGKSRL